MRVILLSLLLIFNLFSINNLYAQSITAPQHSNAPLNVTDGSASCYPYQLSVTSGSLACSNGIATITTGGGGGSSSTTYAITQTAHGLSVGNVVYYTGTAYAKAKADSATTADVVGIVTTVTDANTFTITLSGHVTGLSGFTAGTTYFLSATTAGALTATEPSTNAYVSKPLFVADSTTSGYFINWRGMTIGVPSGTNISGLAQYLSFNLIKPYNYYVTVSTNHTLLLWPKVNATATVTSIYCSANADPSINQFNIDLKYADNYIGLANAVVIQNITATNGAYAKTSGFTHAGIPAGKDIYILQQVSGATSAQELACTIGYYYN